MKWTILYFSLIVAQSAKASYFRAELNSADDDRSKGVHIIVAGKGMEVGDQWLRIAHTQALIYKDHKNHGPVVLISAIDDSNYATYLKTWNYSNTKVFNEDFTAAGLLSLLNEPAKIASIDFIGHNGALLGFALENYNNRFFLNDAKKLISIKNKMSKDSFVRVMGCNTGWRLAPLLAETLAVPASGTFTYADIEKVHSTGDWFYNDANRSPVGTFLNTNNLSYSSPLNCRYEGGCLRLKVVEINYQGRHGSYLGTLPFLKTFCGSMDFNECARRTALSTQFLIGANFLSEKPTLDQYALTLADQFCSSWISSYLRSECKTKIINHITQVKTLPSTFQSVQGKMLSCNMKACSYKENCSSGKCVMEGDFSSPSTATVDELNFYIKGYQLWMAPQL